MRHIGCQRCGLVMEMAEHERNTTRPCHRCVATMRPVTERVAVMLRGRACGRALHASELGTAALR